MILKGKNTVLNYHCRNYDTEIIKLLEYKLEILDLGLSQFLLWS